MKTLLCRKLCIETDKSPLIQLRFTASHRQFEGNEQLLNALETRGRKTFSLENTISNPEISSLDKILVEYEILPETFQCHKETKESGRGGKE